MLSIIGEQSFNNAGKIKHQPNIIAFKKIQDNIGTEKHVWEAPKYCWYCM